MIMIMIMIMIMTMIMNMIMTVVSYHHHEAPRAVRGSVVGSSMDMWCPYGIGRVIWDREVLRIVDPDPSPLKGVISIVGMFPFAGVGVSARTRVIVVVVAVVLVVLVVVIVVVGGGSVQRRPSEDGSKNPIVICVPRRPEVSIGVRRRPGGTAAKVRPPWVTIGVQRCP